MANNKQNKRRQKQAEDFKNQKIKSAKDFNFDQHNRKSVEGTHVSGQEVKHLKSTHKQKGGTGNFRDTYAALQAQKDAGATFGKSAQRQFDRMGERMERLDARKAAKEKAKAAQSTPPADQEQDTNTPAVEPDTQDINLPQEGETGNQTQQNDTDITNTQEQNVDQDNDINTNIDGNNNHVVNNQDNSIRQYGGDNRSLVINSQGSGSVAGALDGVGTAGTLAGLWDADDSPGATAARLDMHQTMNRDAQKKYGDTSHIAQGAIHRAGQNSQINTAALDARVRGREQNSYDRAALMSKSLWGDLSNMNFNWTPNKPAEDVEQPDFDKLTDKHTDF